MTKACITAVALTVVFPLHAEAQREARGPGATSGFTPLSWFASTPQQVGFFRLPGIPGDYTLGPGDELEIFITGFSSNSISARVSNSGDVSLPLLGHLHVNDMTTVQLENQIAASLQKEQLIKDPEVIVNVAEHQGRPIYIIGEVDNPGQYVMSQQLTLVEAILMAGGIDFTAGQYGYLHRRTSEEGPDVRPEVVLQQPKMAQPGHKVITVDLEPLKVGGVLSPDIPMRPGDVFVVPRRSVAVVYVIGDVATPGAFEIPAERKMLAAQVIAATGGPTRTAKVSKGVLVRYDPDGQRREIPVDFGSILRGRKPDFEVQPNDVIFIPGAAAKTLAYGMLDVVPNIVVMSLVF